MVYKIINDNDKLSSSREHDPVKFLLINKRSVRTSEFNILNFLN